MANTRRLGELAKLYYAIVNTDLTQADADLLDGTTATPAITWIELCATNLSTNDANAVYEINDRCSSELTSVAPGRRTFTLDFSINQFRQNPAFGLKAWHAAINAGNTFSMLALNDDRAEANAWGYIGNMVVTSTGTEEPESGLIVVSYSFQPDAASVSDPAARYIYGSGIV